MEPKAIKTLHQRLDIEVMPAFEFSFAQPVNAIGRCGMVVMA
jgi:hypothetical protein